jgi:hypothetical protein
LCRVPCQCHPVSRPSAMMMSCFVHYKLGKFSTHVFELCVSDS